MVYVFLSEGAEEYYHDLIESKYGKRHAIAEVKGCFGKNSVMTRKQYQQYKKKVTKRMRIRLKPKRKSKKRRKRK